VALSQGRDSIILSWDILGEQDSALLIASGGTVNMNSDAGTAVTANLNIFATSAINFSSSQHLNISTRSTSAAEESSG